jgi:putative peptidoglycan lipid II flippase
MTAGSSVPAGRRFTRRSATFIGSFTLAARIAERLGAFGLIALIASVYGSSFLADRYFIASIVPLIIGAITGEALSANIIPALVREGEARAARLVAAGFWLALALLVVVTAAYLAVVSVVVPADAPAGSTEVGVWFAFAPIGILFGVGGYLGGVLTYYERYVWPPFRSAVATVAGFVLTLVVVAFTHDLVWVAAAVTGGYALSLLALLFEVRSAAGPGALGLPSRAGLAHALTLRGGLVAPVLGGLIGGQIFVLFERALASTTGVGAVATLSYARGIVFVPLIVAQSIALGIYPGMVRAFEADDLAHVRESLVRGLRLTLFVGLALAVFFAAYGEETVRVLLERGAFDPHEARQAGTALSVFALALVGSMLMVLVARVFYAVDYFRAVVWTQLCALVVYVAIALPFRNAWGTTGLALAFGVAELTGAALGVWLAARRTRLGIAELLGDAVVPSVGRAALVAAALVGARLVTGSGALGSSALVHLAFGLLVGFLASGIVLWSSGWPELRTLKRGLRRLAPAR